MAFRTRTLSIVLANKVRMYTDSDGTYKLLDLDVPELEGLLPHVDSLQVEWLLDQVGASEVDWNILAYVGWDRDHELSSPVAFFTEDQTGAGPELAAPANFTSGNYRRHVRLQLRWRLHDQVTVPKEAVLSVILHVTTKGV